MLWRASWLGARPCPAARPPPCRAAPGTRLDEVKALLGRMMFSGTSVDKRVGWLSGGEKARLALAKFMLTKGSLLVHRERGAA